MTPRAAWCSSGCDLECFLASLCAWVPPFVCLVPGLVTGALYAAEEGRASGFQLAKGFPAQNQPAREGLKGVYCIAPIYCTYLLVNQR